MFIDVREAYKTAVYVGRHIEDSGLTGADALLPEIASYFDVFVIEDEDGRATIDADDVAELGGKVAAFADKLTRFNLYADERDLRRFKAFAPLSREMRLPTLQTLIEALALNDTKAGARIANGLLKMFFAADELERNLARLSGGRFADEEQEQAKTSERRSNVTPMPQGLIDKCERIVKELPRYMEKTEEGYKWCGTDALFGRFVVWAAEHFKELRRRSNENIEWALFRVWFDMSKGQTDNARQDLAKNCYNTKGLGELMNILED